MISTPERKNSDYNFSEKNLDNVARTHCDVILHRTSSDDVRDEPQRASRLFAAPSHAHRRLETAVAYLPFLYDDGSE